MECFICVISCNANQQFPPYVWGNRGSQQQHDCTTQQVSGRVLAHSKLPALSLQTWSLCSRFFPSDPRIPPLNWHNLACGHVLYFPFKKPSHSTSSRQPSQVLPVFQVFATLSSLVTCGLALSSPLCSVCISEILQALGFPILCSVPHALLSATVLRKCPGEREEGLTEGLCSQV